MIATTVLLPVALKKLVIAFTILSLVPAALVVPLVPFTFFLVDGEGRIPGYFHEYLLHFLMLAYPVILLACLWGARRLVRGGTLKLAVGISLVPLGVFLLLLWTFVWGGIVLR